MFFAVFFEDDTAQHDKRNQFMGDHLAFLERNRTAVKAAGPLKAADRGPVGGLWLVEANNAEDVRQLCQDDPLWTTGLRKSVQIYEWTRVFTNGRRVIERAEP